MGIGKVLPTLVVFSILLMMVFSLLPAYAHPGNTSDHGECPTKFGSPVGVTEVPGTDFSSKDKNGNGHVCVKINNGGHIVVIDDNHVSKRS